MDSLPCRSLLYHIVPHFRLITIVLAGIGMTAVDHQSRRQLCCAQQTAGFCDVFGVVVRPVSATTQNQVPQFVSACTHHARLAVVINSQKLMRRASRLHGVDRDFQTAFGAVLETDRHRKSARHLPMRRRFCRSRTDGRQRDQVCDVLRRDGFQHFSRRWQPDVVDIQQNLSCLAQARRDIKRVIHMRVVDQAFPANGRARLFEIDPHHDDDPVTDFVGDDFQSASVLQRHSGMVDGTWSDDRDHAFVISAENVFNDQHAIERHDPRLRPKQEIPVSVPQEKSAVLYR